MRYILFGWLVWGLAACSTLNLNAGNAPIVTLTSLGLGEVGLFSQTYRIELLVENPNPMPLPVVGMTYNLDLNGKSFARGSSDYTGTVEAFGKQKISVELTSNVTGFIQQIHALQRDGLTRFSYDLKGKLHLSNGLLPMSFNTQDKISLD